MTATQFIIPACILVVNWALTLIAAYALGRVHELKKNNVNLRKLQGMMEG